MSNDSMVEPMEASAPLDAQGIHKSYLLGDGSTLEILRGVDLVVPRGEAVAVVGTSGAGKSTLLHIVGALQRPTRGTVILGGRLTDSLNSETLAMVRAATVGFVFQFHHLLREFSALENVMIPQLVLGRTVAEAEARAEKLLGEVGLADRVRHRPWQLSGGEQQRVAVARALANDPPLLLADEPTGNLDARTGTGLHDLLFRIREERSLSMVLVTHNLELAARADRILHLTEGELLPSGDRGG